MSWTTFVLEILNFLVLVWILKRFLYRPVLDVIAQRRAGIEQTLADAEAHHAEAEKLQAQYEGRIDAWEHEHQQARDRLDRELEAERAHRMAQLQTDLENEHEKARVLEARRQTDARRKIEETAMLQGARFAARLLEQAAGPDTEARLVELVLDDLKQLPVERISVLRDECNQVQKAPRVQSAYPLSQDLRQRLGEALRPLCESAPLFEQDDNLVAGVRIIIGAWVLGANVRDELKGFTELGRGD
jgi:F-type H+-transporting ATPase subunit b